MMPVVSKPQFRPRLQFPSFLDETLRTIIFVIVVTVLFDMAIPRSLVDGRSMEPTFRDQERLVISRLGYLINPPQRGDIVVFNAVDGTKDMLIKRVIGLPHERVDVSMGVVSINGVVLDEPYVNESTCSLRCADLSWQLGEDEYFVMGDNRNHSNDSRAFGAIPLNHIVGHVVFRYWELQRIGFLGSNHYENVP